MTAVDVALVRRARGRLIALAFGLSVLGLGLIGVFAIRAESLAAGFEELGLIALPALALVGSFLIIFMVPASLVAGASGYVGGTTGGTIAALVATTAGAVAAAGIGRWVGTPSARHVLGQRVERALTWFEARPLRATITARLVPERRLTRPATCWVSPGYRFQPSRLGVRSDSHLGALPMRRSGEACAT